MTVELYTQRGCPYCAKVERKLREHDIEYVAHEVPASRWQRDEVEAISGQRGVPVLVDEDTGIDGMAESDDIVAYLDETYGTGAEP